MTDAPVANSAKVSFLILIFKNKFFLGGCPCDDCEACWECTPECKNKEDKNKVDILNTSILKLKFFRSIFYLSQRLTIF